MVKRVVALLAFSIAAIAHGGSPIPPSPTYYVLDEPSLLAPQSLRALQKLLVEHDRVGGEQVMIAVMKELGDEDISERTRAIYREWKIGQTKKDSGVLLALYAKEQKGMVLAGYTLELPLPEVKARAIVDEVLLPRLHAGSPDRAVAAAALEILTLLESPLIQSDKAAEILAPIRELPESSGGGSLWIWIFALAVIVTPSALGLWSRLVPEAHYASSGWSPYRRPLLPNRKARGGAAAGYGGASASW